VAAPRRVREELSALVSHMWMRMPGQSWPGAAASFLGMWIVMTAAMMLPSFVPTLRRYRRELRGARSVRLNWLTALVATGYFFAWTMLGAAIFPLGVALAAVEMRQPSLARLAPIAIGAVVAIAGAMQLSAGKARRLSQCREAFWYGDSARLSASTAWRHGVRLGVDCVYSCAGAMAILLVVGIMDLRAMTIATVAITVERIAPAGVRVARSTGMVAVAAGVILIARAVALG
jgi:predicted metal-binding membrane protein